MPNFNFKDKICPKTVFSVKWRKSEQHHWILHIQISFGTKFQLKLTILTEFFDQHTPFVTKRTNTNISTWMTVELKTKMDCRDMLQWKFCKSKTTKNYEKYKRQRNKVNNLIKRAKKKYNKNLLDENTKSATSFWRTLKSIFPTKPKSKLTSTTFKVNEEEISNKETIANGFGQFFSSIAITPLQTLHPIKDLNHMK